MNDNVDITNGSQTARNSRSLSAQQRRFWVLDDDQVGPTRAAASARGANPNRLAAHAAIANVDDKIIRPGNARLRSVRLTAPR